MEPVNCAPDDLGSLDELVETHIRSLSEKLARSHTLKDLEDEITTLGELVQSFKFRNELLRRIVDDISAAQRKRLLETVAKHGEIVRSNSEQLDELRLRSHRLIERSGKLFAKLGIEKPVAISSLIRQRNLLLASLPSSEYSELIPSLERVAISVGKVLYHPDEPIRYIYFPETAVFTILATMINGASVEVGFAGNEGMLGLRILFGAVVAPTEAVVLVSGTALRMRVEALRDEIRRGSLLKELMLRYSQSALTQARQSSACKNFHSIESRLARWLLTIHDYVELDELMLTQSQIAQIIGSRIAGVSEAASKLQRAGLIRYSRGRIRILQRQALEAAACECFGLMRNEKDRLYESYIRISERMMGLKASD